MYFNRFDICEAYYRYAEYYHTGQFSKEYALFSVFDRIRFNPSVVSGTYNENVREILQNLITGKTKIRDRR